MRIYKGRAIKFFGGIKETAAAMGLTPNAIRLWNRKLSKKLTAQVIGFAIITRGVEDTKAGFPEAFKLSAQKPHVG